MDKQIIIQRIKKVELSSLDKAIRYYKILADINTIPLTERELQLLAFTAIKGNISYSSNREEFYKMYNSSSATINNIISKLKRLHLLIKDGGKIKVNPTILLDFNKDIVLQVCLING